MQPHSVWKQKIPLASGFDGHRILPLGASGSDRVLSALDGYRDIFEDHVFKDQATIGDFRVRVRVRSEDTNRSIGYGAVDKSDRADCLSVWTSIAYIEPN